MNAGCHGSTQVEQPISLWKCAGRLSRKVSCMGQQLRWFIDVHRSWTQDTPKRALCMYQSCLHCYRNTPDDCLLKTNGVFWFPVLECSAHSQGLIALSTWSHNMARVCYVWNKTPCHGEEMNDRLGSTVPFKGMSPTS